MSPPPADRFLAEILEQPAAMRAAACSVGRQLGELAELHRLGAAGAGLVLTGMGSSYDACLAAASVLARRGVLATTVNTAELLHFRRAALSASTPIVAVSQSGNSAELVRLAGELATVHSRPPLVTLTNGLANPLARLADVAFDTAAGVERGPSTKTFAACLVVLRALVDALADGGAFDAPRACAAAAGDAQRAAAAAAHTLENPASLADRMQAWRGERLSTVMLGRGTARAAAEMGALIFKEAARCQAESLDTAEFRHGPLELSGPDLAVAIISTEPATHKLDLRLAAELERDGASVMMIAPAQGEAAGAASAAPGAGAAEDAAAAGTSVGTDALHPLLAPAVAVIPLQVLAWRLAVEGGRDPGHMTRASKVTTTE